VLLLGPAGRNFAAGMSGGVAYVYDPDQSFTRHCNHDMVELERVCEDADIAAVRELLQAHANATGSTVAKGMLEHFDAAITFFTRVMPTDYKRVLQNRQAIAEKAAELAREQV